MYSRRGNSTTSPPRQTLWLDDSAVLGRAKSPFYHSQSSDQLRHFEWLRQVIVGTALQPGHARIDTGTSRQNQDRQRRGAPPNSSKYVEPIDIGQTEVEYDDVGRVCLNNVHGRRSCSHVIRHKTLVAQGFAQSVG